MRQCSLRRRVRSSTSRTRCAGSIARSAAKNFYYGFVVLPPRKRNALTAVYAFMRRCDDIADDTTLPVEDRQEQARRSGWIKSHRALAGQPTDDPVLLALTDAQRPYQIPIGLLDQLAFGTEADLERERDQRKIAGRLPRESGAALVARYRTFEDLGKYCYGVASVVGLVCIRIFGYRDPAAEALAERCGSGVSAHEHHSRRERRRGDGPGVSAGGRSVAVRVAGRRFGRAGAFEDSSAAGV